MKKGHQSLFLAVAFLLIFAAFAVQCTKTDTEQQGATTNTGPQGTPQVREMTVTGVIAEGYNSYVIQGKTPSTMIWTILNPEPPILDEYIKSGKIVEIDLHIVSGDNINIKKIDGKEYP